MGDETSVPTTAPDSALARLRAQRSKLADEAHQFHVHVPRTTDPAIHVAYAPVDPGAMEEAIERRKKAAKSPTAKRNVGLLAAADVLVEHCQGIYTVDEAGKEMGLDPAAPDVWPRFTERLGELLGEETPTAVAACIALFTTKMDLIAHCNTLVVLSGGSADAAEERFRGE